MKGLTSIEEREAPVAGALGRATNAKKGNWGGTTQGGGRLKGWGSRVYPSNEGKNTALSVGLC